MSSWIPPAISVVALALAIGHVLFPLVVVDATTLFLVTVALIPWLRHIFRSFELPGGFKIEFLELEKAEIKAAEAGLLAQPTSISEQPSYLTIAEQDPNLALAGLRIEIERRLRKLAESSGMRIDGMGLGQLLRRMRETEVLTDTEVNLLSDLAGTLNRAVHGASVDGQASQWAIQVGSRLLTALDLKITNEKEAVNTNNLSKSDAAVHQ